VLNVLLDSVDPVASLRLVMRSPKDWTNDEYVNSELKECDIDVLRALNDEDNDKMSEDA
jgi:hypothetical protein